MTETSAPKTGLRPEVAIPVVLFALALFLRLLGIGWGLKNEYHWHSYHPDEAVVFSYSQAIEPTKGDFTPGFYNYGTLYLTVLRVAADMVAVYTGGYDLQKPESVADFMSRGHMAGRFLSALAGAGTVWVVFLLLRRRTGLLGSTMGGLFVALAPAHVVHSRFQTVDIAAAFFVALSTHYALKLLPAQSENPPDTVRGALLAGLFAGLAAGTKYTGGLVILTLLAALAYRMFGGKPSPSPLPRGEGSKAALAGVGAMAAAFLLSTPGALTDRAKFVKDFTYEMQHTATGHGLIFTKTSSGFIYHLANLAAGVGVILVVLGLGGLLWAGFRKHAWAFALLAFLVPYYLLIGRAEVKFLRYTFPLYIGLAAGFGWLMGRAHERRGWAAGLVGLGIAGLGGVDTGGLLGSARFTFWMMGEDPRDEAAGYLKERAKAGPTMVAYASDPWYYSVPLFPTSAAPRWLPLRQRLNDMSEAEAPEVRFFVENPDDPFAFDVRMLDALQPTYVTFSSFESRDLERLRRATGLSPVEQLQVDRYKVFTDALAKRYTPERVFAADSPAAHDLEYVRPTIYLWRRNE